LRARTGVIEQTLRVGSEQEFGHLAKEVTEEIKAAALAAAFLSGFGRDNRRLR
jgi:hypothetical protein